MTSPIKIQSGSSHLAWVWCTGTARVKHGSSTSGSVSHSAHLQAAGAGSPPPHPAQRCGSAVHLSGSCSMSDLLCVCTISLQACTSCMLCLLMSGVSVRPAEVASKPMSMPSHPWTQGCIMCHASLQSYTCLESPSWKPSEEGCLSHHTQLPYLDL